MSIRLKLYQAAFVAALLALIVFAPIRPAAAYMEPASVPAGEVGTTGS